MRIAIGSDHAGFEQKQGIADRLRELGHVVEDLGTDRPEMCDYPPIALAVSEAVAKRSCEAGILLCGTGVGMSIAANKVPGVRAALCTHEKQAHDTRQHNDSNVLVLASRIVSLDVNRRLAETWLGTSFTNIERHARRVGQIGEIEKKYLKG